MTDARVTIAAAVVFAVALAIGIWQFPQALEPRGADAHGIVLNDLVDAGRGNVANDWFKVAPGATAIATPSGLRIRAPRGPRVLATASRSLPVFPHACYRLDLRATVRRPGMSGGVFNENFDRPIRTFELPASTPAELHIAFRTGRNRRVTILLYGRHSSDATFQRIDIEHVNACS